MKLTPDQKNSLTTSATILALPFILAPVLVVYSKALIAWAEFILGLF